MAGYPLSEAGRILKKYNTRDPYTLLEAIGAVTVFSYEYPPDGLKGYSTIMNRVMYAVINGRQPQEDRRIASGHEAAHLILHKGHILASPVRMMKDFNLFDNSGRYEREANIFLADFLVSDEDALCVISDRDRDYFSAARELCLPPQLLAFKLYNMMQRGYQVHNPIDPDNRFLSRR